VIADGVASGDVVITGGGTANLTNVNTYTGTTTIDSGSTLTLSGSGSIAATSLLTNHGIFNVAPKASNTSLTGNYVQQSTGTLAMSLTPSGNPTLLINGTANLAGTLSLNASSGSYGLGSYTLINATGGVSGTFNSLTTNLASYTTNLFSLAYDANNVYLLLSNASAADTQSSIGLSSQRLKGIYNLQSTAVVNGLTYDCQLFDANNICLSTGGRYSNNHGESGSTTSALLIGAYRLDKNIRLGAWVDQNLSTNTVTGIKLSNSKPLFGLFGAWAENPSGEGYEVKVSAGYGDKDLTVTRDVIGTSEAGKGTTRLNSQAISTVSSYGFKLDNDLVASPYVGVQYSRISSDAYSETSATDVTAPLTYGRLSQENVSVLAGLKLSAKLDPKTALFGSVGVEQNVNNRSGQYSATGVDGLTAVNFNSNVQKTRATASAGIYYDIDEKKRVSLSGMYREEAFSPTATTSVLATYTVGF
jgi:autotransporter-associated beta strand protein